jgi:hypothetical protein
MPSRGPAPAVAHSSISKSPSELPPTRIGRLPICVSMPTGLPALSSMKAMPGSFTMVGTPSITS